MKRMEVNTMRKISALLLIMMLTFTLAYGQTITPIADIQYVSDPSVDDASPLVGQVVTISGVVTAEYWGSYKNREMMIQDADSAWSGIYCYQGGDNGWQDFPMTFDPGVDRTTIVEGDSVTLTGEVTEYRKVTQFANATSLVVHGKAKKPFSPIEVTVSDAKAEKYEGVLLRIMDVNVHEPDLGGEWSVIDGNSDVLIIDDKWEYYYYPKTGAGLTSVTGTLFQRESDYKLQPRLARDLVESGPFTRVQRIQQILGSSIYLLPDNPGLDASYMVGDTVTCIGIVRVPTSELSSIDTSVSPWTGYNRFVWQDPNGGPFSSILSYFNDPTAFPDLFEGDSIIITGRISTYAAFTEMWITEPIQLVGVNAKLTDKPVLTTGELSNPVTAEPWEFSLVRVENSNVINNNLSGMEFTIDDGSGELIIDSDGTNSMEGIDQYDNVIGPAFIRPPNGTTIASLEGFVYHTSAYKIRPVYQTDIVLGGGPPTITDYFVTESPLTPDSEVTVNATITDGSAVASADVIYRIDNGTWMNAAMAKGTNDVWSGTVPLVGYEALVEFFIKATDDGLDNQEAPMSTILPDTSNAMFGYHTRYLGHSISDVQFTPYESGSSYYVTAKVSVSGVVTSTADQPNTRCGGFNIQDGTGAWNGIWALLADDTEYTVTQGDSITITGTVIESRDMTTIDEVTAVSVHSTGKSVESYSITGAEYVADPEPYEGVLLNFGEVTVTDSSGYDKTVTDDGGITEFLIDDDYMIHGGVEDMFYHALDIGTIITKLTGISHYYYGEHLVMVRDRADLGISVSVDDMIPLKYSLSQNYPNPFNPVTTIEYSLPKEVRHTLKVYNLRGALVTTLVDGINPAGSYQIIWNAGGLASGLYIVRLETVDFTQTRKLVLLK